MEDTKIPDTAEPLPNPEHDAMGYALAAANIIHRAVVRALTPLVQVVNAYGKEIDMLKDEARSHIPEAEVAPMVAGAVANATAALEAELAQVRAQAVATSEREQNALGAAEIARQALENERRARTPAPAPVSASAGSLQFSLDDVKLARTAAHQAAGSAMGMGGNVAEAFFLLEQKFARVAFAMEQHQQRQAAPKVE